MEEKISVLSMNIFDDYFDYVKIYYFDIFIILL